MDRTDEQMTELVQAIYSSVYGDVDDRAFKHLKTFAIQDWLSDGDLEDEPNLNALIAEWRDYDETEEA